MGRLKRSSRLLALVLALFLVASVPAFTMPPNEMLLTKSLIQRGEIPSNASADEQSRLLRSYLMKKFNGRPIDRMNPLAVKKFQQGENGNGGGFGVQLNRTKNYNILVILVEFAGTDDGHTGPLHNELPQPGPEDNTTFWIPDFNRDHYAEMLFSRRYGAKSMAMYYYNQSGGKYSVTGYVTDWVQLPHSEWYYGADSEDDIDNLNGPVWRIVVDAINELGDSIDWKQFDKEDPYDLDGDGNFNEPDGYIDHLMLVHAGAGQEAGGGAQGDDAIWSHSWWVDFGNGQGPLGLGGVECGTSGIYAGPYTIQPEDGTIGVFCHEFGHDLGLPDVYDTIYSGEESAGFWTLMSSGSWLGAPGEALGTSPSSMGIWEKYLLGYVDPVVVNPGQNRFVSLKPTQLKGKASKAVRVNLPIQHYIEEVTAPYSGSYMWYSNTGDMINYTLTMPEVDLSSATAASLEFAAWYDIEEDWDYAYVEVSTDGGSTWESIPGNITTDTNPNGNNDGYGITGYSGDWVMASFDLSDYVGQVISLRFRYETDQYVHYTGFAVDDISIDTDAGNIFFDDVESGEDGWVADGWFISTGEIEKTAGHYYIIEYRDDRDFDVSMKNWYNFIDYNTGKAEFLEANPGVLVWYRNMKYTDNWVGLHPWEGFLLLVDAHPQLITATGSEDVGQYYFGTPVEVPFRTRLQLFDAAFSTKKAKAGQQITSWYGMIYPTIFPSEDPVRVFDDAEDWFDPTYYYLVFDAPNPAEAYYGVVTRSMNGVNTPELGVKIQLRGMTPYRAYLRIDARNVGK